ncbi:hypothetical protein ACJJTC_007466, partial [Scirpophaga incertulas]
MAMATATATMESSQTLIQSESRVQQKYHQEMTMTEQRQVKKKKSMRRHKDEGSISVSKSSEKLYKKMKAEADGESNPQCQRCSRPVYAMERIKAEKRVWHKECFRCVQCLKQLTVETYQSDHTALYCKPHFKQLFEPKPVEDSDQIDGDIPKKHQMIICESNPVELPPDVVRASDKPDLGLEELSQLDVKSRFEVFEKRTREPDPSPVTEPRAPREKSTALLSKLAKFKAKGMDVGVSDEYLNGVPVESSSSEPEDEEDEDSVLRKSYKHTSNREQPMSFCNMNEIKDKFETGQHESSQRHRERKQEIQNIRSRLFMGKQAKIKEMYEQSVLQSEQSVTSADKIARELDLDAEKSRSIKQRFENGEIFNDENQPPRNREIDDQSLFNEGIGKKSRSIFLELDANAKNLPPTSPPPQEPPRRKEIPFVPKDLVRSADKPEERPKSPSPEVYKDPEVARADEASEDRVGEARLAADRHTASRMIGVFRRLEAEQHHNNNIDQGPKPLKRFTPPPPGEKTHTGDTSESEDEEYSYEEEDSEDERRRLAEIRRNDEALKQAQQLARTTSFRGRFENWTDGENVRPQREMPRNLPQDLGRYQDRDGDQDDESQLETAK